MLVTIQPGRLMRPVRIHLRGTRMMRNLASRAGFEPATCRVEAGRSVRLSYPDQSTLALWDGFEPSCPPSESGILSVR